MPSPTRLCPLPWVPVKAAQGTAAPSIRTAVQSATHHGISYSPSGFGYISRAPPIDFPPLQSCCRTVSGCGNIPPLPVPADQTRAHLATADGQEWDAGPCHPSHRGSIRKLRHQRAARHTTQTRGANLSSLKLMAKRLQVSSLLTPTV